MHPARSGDRNVVGGDRHLPDRGIGFLRRGDRYTLDRWNVAPSAPTNPVTGYSLTGPASGVVGIVSTPFTVTLIPIDGTMTGSVTVTPSDQVAGGTFTPPTVSLSTASHTATFTYTPSITGTRTISCTNNGGLANPAGASYVVTAPPPFDPSTIAGLQVWLKADAITTPGLVKPGPRAEPFDTPVQPLTINDGDPVNTWPDSSVNGRNFVPAFGVPTYKAGIVNGKPVVRYGANKAHQNASGVFTVGHYTLFVVTAPLDVAAAGYVFSSGDGTVSSIVLENNAGQLSFTQTQAPGSGISVTEAGGFVVGSWNVLSANWDGANIHLWRNGVLKGTSAITAIAQTGLGTYVGIEQMNGFYNGDVAEVLVYNSALSTTDRQNVEGYLKAKYATP